MPQALWHRNRVRALTDGARRLSDLPDDEARAALLACWNDARWAERMLSQRPFKSRDEVFESAERFWRQAAPEAPAAGFAAVRAALEQLLTL